jgi:hypothetical protein
MKEFWLCKNFQKKILNPCKEKKKMLFNVKQCNVLSIRSWHFFIDYFRSHVTKIISQISWKLLWRKISKFETFSVYKERKLLFITSKQGLIVTITSRCSLIKWIFYRAFAYLLFFLNQVKIILRPLSVFLHFLSIINILIWYLFTVLCSQNF